MGYGVCFHGMEQKTQRVWLDLKVGVDAKDYSSVAKREHLEPIEVKLLHISEEVQGLLKSIELQRNMQMNMTATTFVTQTRVLWFSCLTIFILIICACGKLAI